MKNGWILLCLISILLLPNVTAQAGDFLYTSDQLVFEYKFMELDSRTQYSDVLKRNDILRFELSSSIKAYTQDEFEDKLALLSIYINGESANPDIVEIFIYRVYLPVNGVDNDLFEDSDTLRLYYDIVGDPVINGDEISFHMEEADGPGVITVDHKYNKDTGILISYYADYVDENQTIILEYMISTEYSDSTESGSTDTETALFPFLPLIIGISIIIKFRKMRL